jgi:hypothetical protein
MAERELLVRILGDDRDLQRALGNTDKRLTAIDNRTAAFGRNIGRAFAAAGVTLGTAAVFSVLGDAIDDASALNEEIAKSRQIFGDASTAIEAWSETTARSIGVAQVEALRATGTFGNLFATIGAGQEEAANMSRELVQLAADLASFNNADITDVLAAIRSGLIGEAEPLRRYGVLLSEARVQQVAMAASGKDNVKALTNQEKALARYNIILTDTAIAQGDFARTSDSLANQSRILRAQLSDLSAELGTKLLPALLGIVSATNDLIDVFTRAGDSLDPRLGASLEDVDVSGLVAMRDRLAEIKGEGSDAVRVLDEIISRLRAVQGILVGGPDSRGGLRGPGGIAITNQRVEAENAEEAARQAKREQERARKAFAEFIKGQELKLDKAGLTATLDDDLAVLRAIEAAIERRIATEGRTYELVSQLTAVRKEIARTTQAQSDAAQQASEDAFNATVDALTLDVDTARATKSLADDQTALRALEQAILRRIASEGETTDLLRQLFQVRQEQKEVAERLADQRRQQRQGRQFEALGLTAEGQERAPSARALRRRGESLEERIKGTTLDTAKNRQVLENAARVLSGQFGKVGRDVRLAIEGMFDEIAAGLDSGTKKIGPLTATAGLNTKKMLAGLGLSPEEINVLRGRLSGFNTAGRGLAVPASLQPGVPVGVGAGATAGIVVESHTTINLDGQKVANVVTRNQQKARRRNPKQKRGPNRNR